MTQTSTTAYQTHKPFRFTDANAKRAEAIIAKYPKGRARSAVLPLLDMAQRQNGGWLSQEAIEHVAQVINTPVMQVMEVASFYSMFHLQPIGRNLVQVCHTTPCWLRGSDEIVEALEKHLGVSADCSVTRDGLFSLMRVECLGACVNAPVVQINDDYYEDLTPQSAIAIVSSIKRGQAPKVGSAIGRSGSAPAVSAAARKKK